VLYVNGEPYVLRDVECPFTNLEYPGIDKERVEDVRPLPISPRVCHVMHPSLDRSLPVCSL
jgi:hypothetical protein